MGHQPTFYGASLDVALWEAASALGREPGELEYRSEELSNGQVKVEIVNAPEKKGPAPKPKPLPKKEKAKEKAATPEAKTARTSGTNVADIPRDLPPRAFLAAVFEQILEYMQLPSEFAVDEHEGALCVELPETSANAFFDGDARLLDALQYIANRIVQHHYSSAPAINVDLAGRRTARNSKIVALAERVAERVAGLNAGLWIEGASSADRRAIHHSLADRRDVSTESDGVGGFRRLHVRPVRND